MPAVALAHLAAGRPVVRASEPPTLREASTVLYDSRGCGVDAARAATLDPHGDLIVVGGGGLALGCPQVPPLCP